MRIREIRYYFEHRLLPDCFYKYKEKFIMALLTSEGKFLYDIMSDLCRESQEENIYSLEMYKVSACKLEDGTRIVKLDMPKPESEPLCYRIYLVFDESFEKADYLTAERGIMEEQIFLCGWDENGEHFNFGDTTEKEEWERILELSCR